MKDETYPTYKHARGINSRSDEFKCAVGPIFRLIEKAVFKHEAFIKKIPVKDRPQYIIDMIQRQGAVYVATDYTAFESLFVAELMESCEFELYDYMTSKLPQHDWFMQLCHKVLAGENICEFKDFVISLEAVRMSGEMCTSLGNGFSNLMFMLFMCQECGCDDPMGVVEGDDGLFSMKGVPPTKEHFSKLGLNIKLEVHHSLETASFCGLIFDAEDKLNITDPREVLATFGWTTANYARARPSVHRTLLRCKAISLAYQYPGCPILNALAEKTLELTRSHDVRHMVQQWKNTYERDQLLDALKAKLILQPPPMRTRLLVEQMYDIPVDHQVKIELWIRGLTCIQPLNHPLILMHMSPVWVDYYDRYCLNEITRNPAAAWPQDPNCCKNIPLLVDVEE